MNITIVIPHYGPTRSITPLLKGINELSYPKESLEVIVVTDNTPLSTSSELKKDFPEVIWIENETHIGTAKAKNLGAARARSNWIVFLDDDLELTDSWLQEMAKDALHYPEVPCFQAKVLFKGGRQINSTGGVANVLGYSWDRGVFEEEDLQFDHQKNIQFATSCAMMVRKDAFLLVGGFDDDFFYMGEDYDLGLRLRMAGYRINFVPDAICYHEKTSHEKETILHSKYFLERNRNLVILKNYPLHNLIPALLVLFFLKIWKYISYLFTFKRHKSFYSGEILKGWLWIVAHLPSVIRKRKEVARFRRKSLKELFVGFENHRYFVKSVREQTPSYETTQVAPEALPEVGNARRYIS